MIKIASLAHWGLDSPGTVLAKMSSRGLQGEDRRRLQKVAGESFAWKCRGTEIEPHLEPVYAAALASTESHGFNRNGDGYRAQMLDKCAETYVKHGRMYRNHKAKDPNKSFGIIKIAEYDPVMGIVHVLGGLFKTAEAARLHGGGNQATEELEALAKHGSYATSQGSSIIGGDHCVICGKNSSRREDYCMAKSAGGSCELFGCREGLGLIADDGRHQGLDNSNGIFHDLSKVGFGADRQSFAYRVAEGDIQKAASGQAVPGIRGAAWLADCYGAEAPVFIPETASENVRSMLKVASLYAEIEARTRQELSVRTCADEDMDVGIRPEIVGSQLAKHASSDVDAYANAAAKTSAYNSIILSPVEFFKAAGLCDSDIAACVSSTATYFSRLMRNADEAHNLAKAAAEETLRVTVDSPAPVQKRAMAFDADSIRHRALQKLAEGATASVLRDDITPNMSKAGAQALRKYAVYRMRTAALLLDSSPHVVNLAVRQAQLY